LVGSTDPAGLQESLACIINVTLVPDGIEMDPVWPRGWISRLPRLPLGPTAVMVFGLSGMEQGPLPTFVMGTVQTALPIAPPDVTDPTVRNLGVHVSGIGFGDVVIVGIVAGLFIHGTAVVVAKPVWVVVVELTGEEAIAAVLLAPIPQAVRVSAKISSATPTRGLCFGIRILILTGIKSFGLRLARSSGFCTTRGELLTI
jgi:hypothetical protein